MSLNTDRTGVIVVDMQADFTLLRHGSLAVGQTDQSYLDKVVSATRKLSDKGYKIFATQDFHPENHVSFYTSHKGKAPYETIEIDGRVQMLWPPHCVQGTKNAELLLDKTLFSAIVPKGTDPEYDSYSGFFDDNGMATGLADILASHHVTTLIVYGLAIDYCVKATAMDALTAGFEVILIRDLCRGVAEDTTKTALEEMKAAGINLISTVSNIG